MGGIKLQELPGSDRPGRYVAFNDPSSEPASMAGSVMVFLLEDKPQEEATEKWLDAAKRSANLNPIISEQRCIVNGLSALRVRYKNDRAFVEMDVY